MTKKEMCVCAVIYLIVLPALIVGVNTVIDDSFTMQTLANAIASGVGGLIGFSLGMIIGRTTKKEDDNNAR